VIEALRNPLVGRGQRGRVEIGIDLMVIERKNVLVLEALIARGPDGDKLVSGHGRITLIRERLMVGVDAGMSDGKPVVVGEVQRRRVEIGIDLRVIGCKSILVLQLDKVVYPIESGGILALALKKKSLLTHGQYC